MGKGTKKLGGAEGPEAVEPRWTLGHANLLGRWEDIYTNMKAGAQTEMT